jgi:hypothetical protein
MITIIISVRAKNRDILKVYSIQPTRYQFVTQKEVYFEWRHAQ